MESEKICTRCKIKKNLSEYSMHSASKDRKQSQCKDCFAERARITRQGKPCITCGKPKEIGVPKGARLCLSCAKVCFVCKERPRAKQHRKCKECIAAADKVRKTTEEAKFASRITRIASKYHVPRAFASVLAASKWCAACGKLCDGSGELHVDHCHKTGKVRGVLCFNCNAALGHIGDSVERLLMLVQYLNAADRLIAGMSDIEKARHFIDILIELEERNNHAEEKTAD